MAFSCSEKQPASYALFPYSSTQTQLRKQQWCAGSSTAQVALVRKQQCCAGSKGSMSKGHVVSETCPWHSHALAWPALGTLP